MVYLPLKMVLENKHKLSKLDSIIDESFDKNKSVFYKLIIQLSVDGIYLCVYDFVTLKYLAFEHFTFQNAFTLDATSEIFESVLKESSLFNLKYKKVNCLITHNIATLVPNALYDEEQKKMFLKSTTNLDNLSIVLVDDLKTLESKNVFALPISLKAKLDYIHSNIVYNHFSSGLIENLLMQTKNQNKKQLFVHVQGSHFETIVIDEKNLIFYNSFNHHTAEDFMYYLLFVCEQLELNPETIELVIVGELDRNSNLFSLITKYVRNVKFGERKDTACYGYKLQNIPKHFYYSIFNNYYI